MTLLTRRGDLWRAPARRRSPGWASLLALAPLLAPACTDAPTSPRPTDLRPAAQEAPVRRLERPRLVSNRIKYRDTGVQPATGRSGSASLTVRALLGRDGRTELDVSTDEPLDDGYAPGTLSHVQVKAFDPEGALMRTWNHPRPAEGGYATFTYPAIPRGSRVQVQANVRGIDPRRTDVVTVNAPVALRPNLRAVSIFAPERTFSTALWIRATIAETNGDVGAWANCVLYVNGARSDMVAGAWVNAGDRADCAFFHEFASVGEQHLEVRVEQVVPRDDDPGDNSATAVIQVLTWGQGRYAAYVGNEDFYMYTFQWVRWQNADGSGKEYSWEERDHEYHPRRGFEYLPAAAFTDSVLRIEVTEETGGNVVRSFTYEVPRAEYGDGCSDWIDPTTGARVHLCQLFGWTSLSYDSGGLWVVYFSREYSRTWDASGTTEEYVHLVSFAEGSQQVTAFGDTYTFHVRMIDGATVHGGDYVVPLIHDLIESDDPRACDSVDEPNGTRVDWCMEGRHRIESYTGETSG